MTRTKIMQAAFHNFGEHGFSGGSLAQIAEIVGIRKQSIYTYFKSKDALYLAISKEAMESELRFTTQFMDEHLEHSIEATLYTLLKLLQKRFETYDETKFFIRSTFLPPQHLEQSLLEQTYFYLDSLEALFTLYFNKQSLAVSAEDAAVSFLALLDSLYVEMLYGGNERFVKRLQAGWKIFYRGITN